MSESTLVFLLMIAVILAAVIALGRQNERRRDRALSKKLSASFGKAPSKKTGAERYENIPGYLKRHPQKDQIDAITWNDLDMDSVFQRIDDTKSAVGEEYLYYLLHTPKTQEGQERAELPEEAVLFFAEDVHQDERLRVQKILSGLGHMGKYSFYDYLDLLAGLPERSSTRHYIAFALPILSIALMFVSAQGGVILLILVIILNMSTYLKEKREIDGYLACIRYILRLLHAAQRLVSSGITIPGEETETLARDAGALSGFARGSFLVTGAGSGNPIDVLLDYIRMIFHADLIKFNQMAREVQSHREEIDGMAMILGRIDTEISTASFRRSLPVWCTPSFTAAGDIGIRAEGLYHPLLAAPVANDLATKQSILLTGSNASGKSTFLKSVALCALLGQTIGTSPAASYAAPRFVIISSMALRDSIAKGESYFMAEIRSLKRIRDAADRAEDPGTAPVLAFIDEVLRGTNTVERIAASTEILHDLSKGRILIFAATHDGELTESLQGDFANYHFEEAWDGKDVSFSYRLHRGRATTRNAIRLLAAVGFGKDVTDRAEKLAEDFERTGEWDWSQI